MNHIYQQPQFGEDWFTYPNLYTRFVRMLREGQRIVEVGSWKGKSTAYLAVEIVNSGKKILFDAVDTWKGSSEHINDPYVRTDKLYALFQANISPVSHVVNPVREESTAAAKLYEDESIDIVFIDASHEYDHIKNDIAAWYPKVKSGGIISGHDYGWAGVKRAVHEAFGQQNVEDTEMCWVYRKP